MKVSELEGATLDFWVAKAEGLKPEIYGKWCHVPIELSTQYLATQGYMPSTDWRCGGPIIERTRMKIHFEQNEWCAFVNNYWQYGPTLLIAAMRAFVASHFGNEVEDAALQARALI